MLGYIVAGFLCSGNFLLEGVSNVDNVNIWAEIGIIFLLFSLGLEFSFNKLLEVGGSALMTALVIILGMMCTGFMAGRLLGWTTTDSVFLGGMLSMSSTTIIIKAFDDLGLRNRKFTGQVFGVLIVEDLLRWCCWYSSQPSICRKPQMTYKSSVACLNCSSSWWLGLSWRYT